MKDFDPEEFLANFDFGSVTKEDLETMTALTKKLKEKMREVAASDRGSQEMVYEVELMLADLEDKIAQ